MKKLLVLLACAWSTCAFGSEIVTVPLKDSVSIQGRLSLPASKQNVPVLVVFVPGTGPNTYLNKRKIGNVEFNHYDLFETEFNKRGVGLFTYNRRGVELGDTPPNYDRIDSATYAKYTPKQEVLDVEAILVELRKDNRLNKTKILLLGASEGSIIAAMVAERMVEQVDGLLLFGYANDNMFDIINFLDIPVYLFQAVNNNQKNVLPAKKTNLKCFVFENHDHDLNFLDWPLKQQISEGLKAIFDTSALFNN